MLIQDNLLVDRLRKSYKGWKNLTLNEVFYLELNLKPNKGYALGVLPYVTDFEKNIADSIAKKLNLRKWYRGPRYARSYSNKPCSTLKEDATGVALYNKC